MKKFFSILCAFAIVFSASATPIQVKKASKELKNNQKVEQVRAKKNAVKPTADFRQFTQKQELTAPVKTAKVAKAKKETINLSFNSEENEVKWYDYCASEGWWQIYSSDDEYAQFSISNVNAAEAAGTYAWEDLDHDWTFYKLESEAADGYPRHYFTDGSCTVATDEAGNVTVEGTFVDEEGNTFNVSIAYTAEEPIEIKSDTVVFEEPMLEPYFYADGSVELAAANDLYDLTLCYFPAEEGNPAGEFNTEDFDLDWSYLYVGETKLYFEEAHLVVTDNGAGRLDAVVDLVTEGGYNFKFTMFYQAPDDPVKEGEYKLTATNLEVNDSYAAWFGIIILEASDDNVAVELYVPGDAAGASLAGTYEIGKNAEASAYFTTADGEVEGFSGNITIAYNEAGYKVTGKILAWDNIEYTLDLSLEIPPVSREQDITIDGLECVLYDFGAWQVAGYNEDETQYVSLAAYTDEVAGTYAAADLAAQYCYVVTDIEGSTYNYFEMIDANITVAVNGDEATLTGTFIGFDGTETVQFNLNIKASIAEPEDTAHPGDQEEDYIHNFAEYEIDDTNLADWGSLYVEALDEELNYIILDITLPEGAEELVAGEYPFSDEYDEQTVYAGFYSDSYGYIPSFVNIAVEQDGKYYYGEEFWWPVEGTVTIWENGVILVDAINSKGAAIKCRLGGAEAIDNVDANAVATKRVVKGQLLIEKNGVIYNAQGAVVK